MCIRDRNRTPAKASVVVTPFPGRVVSASQVQAIVHMVASSVPYLAADGVSVVDQRGKLLTDSSKFASMQLNGEQMIHKQQMEEIYRNRIDSFLSPVVGIGNVRSEVDMQIDFTEIESTFEDYDGNNAGPLARSEVLNVEQEPVGGAASGIPGAASNTSFIIVSSSSNPALSTAAAARRFVSSSTEEMSGSTGITPVGGFSIVGASLGRLLRQDVAFSNA